MIRQLSFKGTKLLLFLFSMVMFCLVTTGSAYAATPVCNTAVSEAVPVAIEVATIHREVPEYICVSADEPSSNQYRYFIDDDGLVCIKDSNGKIFAKQCSCEDINAIYVYTASENELVPMTKNGKQIVVSLIG